MYQVLSGILNHPLNKGHPVKALSRFAKWQWKSRTVGSDIVPFVDNTKLMIRRGMHSATAQHYCGLADFEEMGFVLHALRAGDLFFDVGANVGVYSVLAGVTGADVVAFEPCFSTYQRLLTNLTINHMRERVEAHQCAVGAKDGLLVMVTDTLDSCNHVIQDDELEGEHVDMRTLSSSWPRENGWPVVPELAVLKIDVEGYEKDVIDGAEWTMKHPCVKAVIIELLNGSGCRYGYDDMDLHRRLMGMGFGLYRYLPLKRELWATSTLIGGNNLYVRDAEFVRERLKTAPKHRVHGREI
jgi:FkbM family methyltransferase